jgi:hypothetical protein
MGRRDSPGPDSGRFVEVEDEAGKYLTPQVAVCWRGAIPKSETVAAQPRKKDNIGRYPTGVRRSQEILDPTSQTAARKGSSAVITPSYRTFICVGRPCQIGIAASDRRVVFRSTCPAMRREWKIRPCPDQRLQCWQCGKDVSLPRT